MPFLHRQLTSKCGLVVRQHLEVNEAIKVVSRGERRGVLLVAMLGHPPGEVCIGADVESMALVAQDLDKSFHSAASPEILNPRFATVQD